MALDELVLAVQGGESRAWNELGRRLIAELGPYFRRKFGEVDGNDLTQSTLLIIARKLPQYEVEPGKPFIHWVRAIARREAQEAFRQQQRRARLAVEMAEIVPTPSTNLNSRLVWAERRELVAEAIGKLDSAHRRVIQHDLDEGDKDEFAEREGIQTGTVRSRRRRAHRELQRLVHE
jgi:RNA polymerase sigma factor (sigma-70 family)